MTSAKTRANAKRAYIDKNLPHQVALPNDLCCMENYTLIENFYRRFDRQPQTLQVKAKWPRQAGGVPALLLCEPRGRRGLRRAFRGCAFRRAQGSRERPGQRRLAAN